VPLRTSRVLLSGGLLLAACPFLFGAAPLSRPTRPDAPAQVEASGTQSASKAASASNKAGAEKSSAKSPAPVRKGSGAKAGRPVSAESFCKALGLTFRWVERDKSFTCSKEGLKLEFEVDSRECFLGGQRVFLGEPVRSSKVGPVLSHIDVEKLVYPFVSPGRGAGKPPGTRIVVLDPGHGGVDAGKINTTLGVNEKTFTLDTALRTKKLLEARGFKVVLTRKDDRFLELAERPELTDKQNGDLFVSIHFNSVESKADKVTGVEVFTLTPQWQLSTDQSPDPIYAPIPNSGNSFDHWNAALGAALHKELVSGLKASDRGLKRSRFAVLRLAPCPAVLIEAGYLSNNAEARQIATPKYRQLIAESIAAGIERYADAVEKARKAR